MRVRESCCEVPHLPHRLFAADPASPVSACGVLRTVLVDALNSLRPGPPCVTGRRRIPSVCWPSSKLPCGDPEKVTYGSPSDRCRRSRRVSWLYRDRVLARGIPRNAAEQAAATGVHYLGRESARARSARSSVEIGQCSSQLTQYASISAPDFSSSASSSRGYPARRQSRPHLGHSDENGVRSLISVISRRVGAQVSAGLHGLARNALRNRLPQVFCAFL